MKLSHMFKVVLSQIKFEFRDPRSRLRSSKVKDKVVPSLIQWGKLARTIQWRKQLEKYWQQGYTYWSVQNLRSMTELNKYIYQNVILNELIEKYIGGRGREGVRRGCCGRDTGLVWKLDGFSEFGCVGSNCERAQRESFLIQSQEVS